jgi:phosphatidylglycerol:prolipoprotein diacylglycerol transferase
MYPVIIQIGPVIVYTLWLFVGIAFIAGVFIFTYLAKKKRLNMSFIYNHSFAIFLSTIIGARLFFVLSNFQLYFTEFSPQSLLSVLYIWDKGLSLTGAIAGLVFSIVYYSYRNNEQTTKWLDILTISIIAAMGIGHIGTFLDGSFYGKETDLPWGMVFESPSIKYAVPIHPVQLYAAILSFLIAFILYIIYKKNIYKKGFITITGMLSYFLMIFLLGFLRGDDVLEFLFLRIEQWFSLLMLVITGSYIIYRYNKDKKLKLKKE